jgi:hypothetical protein
MLAQAQTSRPRSLWGSWWDAIRFLRPAFSRLRSFWWFATIVTGLTVRTELAGVTSIIRALDLQPRLYNELLRKFHSSAVKLDRLSALWTQAVLRLFPGPVRVNGRLVLVGDGIKIGKRGKKMPAVKLLHQQSESNTKPEFIMGHSWQAVGLLVKAGGTELSAAQGGTRAGPLRGPRLARLASPCHPGLPGLCLPAVGAPAA